MADDQTKLTGPGFARAYRPRGRRVKRAPAGPPATLRLRDVPPALREALAAAAKRRGRTLNAFILEVLQGWINLSRGL